jgi:hypothetical protein
MWNVYTRDICTKNYVEGWHHKFNDQINNRHVNVWLLIEYFKKENRQIEIIEHRANIDFGENNANILYRNVNERSIN